MRPVIVTTEFRGVFFGYTEDSTGENIILKNARNCIYWSSAQGGFMGLASKTLSEDCRIGAEVLSIDLRKVSSVLEMSKEAEESWRNFPVYRG